MKRILVMSAFALMALALVPTMAQASTIQCGTSQRILTVYNVTSCAYGADQNPNESTIAGALGGVWTKEGTVEDVNGTIDLLTVTVTNGWGSESDGTFSINPSFWSTWGRGAISFHVGQGNGDPDYWVFELVQGFTGPGTFDLNRLMDGGGGLSNIVLFGSGQPTSQQLCEGEACTATPEPASLVLLGSGLVGAATVLRRRTRRA